MTKPKLNSKGIITMLCVFHEDGSPSLRIWPSGFYKCTGCGASGLAEEDAELRALYDRARRAERENAGQMKLF